MPRQHPRKWHQNLWGWDPAISIFKLIGFQVIPGCGQVGNKRASHTFPFICKGLNTAWTLSSGSWHYCPPSVNHTPARMAATCGGWQNLYEQNGALVIYFTPQSKNWREMNINSTEGQAAPRISHHWHQAHSFLLGRTNYSAKISKSKPWACRCE